MANDLPIISSNYDGANEIISNKKTGLIFDLQKKGDLLRKMKILASSEEKRLYLSKNARKFIFNYSLDSIACRWREVFEGILK